jgi:heme exporter protein C
MERLIRISKYSSIVLITATLVAGMAIPMVASPSGFVQFPIIPGLEEKARNIFYHVPVAWTTVVAFLTSMFFGLRYLRSSNFEDDIRSVTAAGLGFLFCTLATITGSLWAKFNWGSFWNWDPRETSIFALLLIYGAYFALRSAIDEEDRRAKLSAVYSAIAGLTVPFFIFVLPRIVGGLHPGAKGDPSGGGPVVQFKMAPNMLVVFFAGLIGFSLFFVWLFSLRVRVERHLYHLSQKES